MRQVRIKEVWRLDVDGRVFAYRVHANSVRFLSAWTVLFIDDRGDGVFRVMEYASPHFKMDKPAWVTARP